MSVPRIKLNEQQARMLFWILSDERLRLLDERRYARAVGVTLTTYQQLTGEIAALRHELLQLADEQHWDYGQPEYKN